MNTKRKLTTFILVGGLALATWAFAQTAFKADGVIESTQGGFKFPDKSIQTTAYSSSIEIYRAMDTWSGNSFGFSCSFSVPAGKILVIEQISGWHQGDGAHQTAAYMYLYPGYLYSYFVPAFGVKYDVLSSSLYAYEAKNVGYMTTDFDVRGDMPESGTNVTFANCIVTGRLIDAP